jgi:hypothetical protein
MKRSIKLTSLCEAADLLLIHFKYIKREYDLHVQDEQWSKHGGSIEGWITNLQYASGSFQKKITFNLVQ